MPHKNRVSINCFLGVLCLNLIFLFFSNSCSAQESERRWIDTNTMFTRKEAKERFSFALKFNYALGLNFLNKEKREYLTGNASLNNEFGIAWYQWNLAIGWNFFKSKLKQDIFLQDQLLKSGSSFEIWRNSLNLGYSFDLIPKLSIQPRVGVVRIKHHPPSDMELNQFFRSYRSSGVELGIAIYNYWHIRSLVAQGKGFPFVAWFVSFDQTFIDYTRVYPGFGRNSFIFQLGAEFKPYFFELKPKKRVVL